MLSGGRRALQVVAKLLGHGLDVAHSVLGPLSADTKLRGLELRVGSGG